MLRLIKGPVIRVLKVVLPRLPVDFLEAALYRSILRTKFSALHASRKIEKREHVWDFAVQTIGAEKKVLFLEFGVWEGYSIKYFASKLPSAGSRFHGFDSFEGLPETWGRNRAGTFSTGGQVPAVDDSRISFVKGWFQDTLPPFAVDGGEFDVVLVHLDADLYSSTLFALMNLWHRFDSFYVIFDEFINHETRAFYNFSQCCPCRIEFLAHDHELPSRVFCKVTVQRTARSA
jgi:O-methyltransferase